MGLKKDAYIYDYLRNGPESSTFQNPVDGHEHFRTVQHFKVKCQLTTLILTWVL